MESMEGDGRRRGRDGVDVDLNGTGLEKPRYMSICDIHDDDELMEDDG
jgi:hypothetical protein